MLTDFQTSFTVDRLAGGKAIIKYLTKIYIP